MGVVQGKYQEANVFTALQYGAYEVKYWIETTLESLKMLFTGEVGMDQLSGPVGIVDVVDETYQANKTYGVSSVLFGLINLSILLSANLGVMNLLPLPALDGGDLCFCLRRQSEEKEYRRKRRHGTSCRTDCAVRTDDICNVQRYKTIILINWGRSEMTKHYVPN